MIDHKKNKEYAKRNLVVAPNDHWKFEYFVEDYLQTMADEIVAEFDFVWESQQENEEVYGDADWSVTKIDDGKLRVLHLNDHSTCNPINQFLVIKEVGEIYEKLHIRNVWNDDVTDYVDGNTYISKPNLQWYKDREFKLDYDDKLHMTALGNSYGDCRDAGFLMTLERMNFGDLNFPSKAKDIDGINTWKVEKGTIYRWGEYKVAIRNLFGCRHDIEDN